MPSACGDSAQVIRHRSVRVDQGSSSLLSWAMVIDVVLPCLNEAEALPWVLSRMPDRFHPIVADNGSTDESAKIAADFGATVVRVPRRGFGAACHAGFLRGTSEVACSMEFNAFSLSAILH